MGTEKGKFICLDCGCDEVIIHGTFVSCSHCKNEGFSDRSKFNFKEVRPLTYEEQLEENARLGAEIIGKYLKGEKAGTDKIKYASNAITQQLKHRATKGAIDTIKLAVAKSISENAAELRTYIKENMPEYGGQKAIGK